MKKNNLKNIVSLLLIVGILFTNFPMLIFAKNNRQDLNIKVKNNNILEVVEDGIVKYIKVKESDNYRKVTIEDYDGNLLGEFDYDKISGQLYSSFSN